MGILEFDHLSADNRTSTEQALFKRKSVKKRRENDESGHLLCNDIRRLCFLANHGKSPRLDRPPPRLEEVGDRSGEQEKEGRAASASQAERSSRVSLGLTEMLEDWIRPTGALCWWERLLMLKSVEVLR
ncbi:hypothetical protein CRYUN_Cryun21dG0059100 [Craigia yunnanensis]